MAQRVRIPHRGQCPSSARQLPILAALHARFPTLFGIIIHDKKANVNAFLSGFGKLPHLFPKMDVQGHLFGENDEKHSKWT